MNPMLLDFPDHFETERLFIRSPKPGDGKAMYEAVCDSINELKPWLPFAHFEQSLEKTEANIREAHVNFLSRKDLRLLVFLKETGELIASSGLHRMDWEVPKVEIGYWIRTDYSGKGFMTEAVQGITDFAINELHARRIEIRCDAKNVKSRAIAERLNFELEAILKQESKAIDRDELRDTCVFAKIR
ncbi:GNAT family N-acetyltransferase [Alkalicoccobacillus murimartini]|uniref:RimJ/RimL family protein N-acetyltransferase n=1 Tax=Alkalicoccobacillus murimartini TaxID=171685 RepID=A0ABT9YKR8_9BACI|nr:GNAT family N-acetyltransferase [Alkalicoccobacillus murimartini]MDQ0208465.1 RimJ/RimL family protein N-acetyltransferase [Alkalicoccobacillus murimartini]